MAVLPAPRAAEEIMLLKKTYHQNWEQLTAALRHTIGLPGWDLCVLTARDKAQAVAFEAEIATRRENRMLLTDTRFGVMADPEGQRVGSGGATLRALENLASELEDGVQLLSSQSEPARHVLIIHPGGEPKFSRTAPSEDSLFRVLPYRLPNGLPATRFDETLASLSALPERLSEGAMIVSGNSLLLFSVPELSLTNAGVTAIAMVVPAAEAVGRRVLVTEGPSSVVEAYMDRPSLQQMEKADAVLPDGTALVDTGLLWMDRLAISRAVTLQQHLQDHVAPGITLHLWGDLLASLTHAAEYASYITDTREGPVPQTLQTARRLIWNTLRGTPLHVERLTAAVSAHVDQAETFASLVSSHDGVRASESDTSGE